jgi:hypothetical protein
LRTEVYICARGIFSRKGSLNNWVVLYFSEIKWFREHFEATTFLLLPEFLTVILTMYCVTIWETLT